MHTDIKNAQWCIYVRGGRFLDFTPLFPVLVKIINVNTYNSVFNDPILSLIFFNFSNISSIKFRIYLLNGLDV